MSSVTYRIERYYDGSFGCPYFDLMGYTNLANLYRDCELEIVKKNLKVSKNEFCD